MNRSLVGSSTADKVFKAGGILGELGTLLGTASIVYAVRRFKDQPKVSHVGMDLIRSLIIAEGLAQGLKYTTRRERPDGSGRTAFPSGHAADTFGSRRPSSVISAGAAPYLPLYSPPTWQSRGSRPIVTG